MFGDQVPQGPRLRHWNPSLPVYPATNLVNCSNRNRNLNQAGRPTPDSHPSAPGILFLKGIIHSKLEKTELKKKDLE